LSSIGHAQPLALASAANIPTGLAGAEGEWSREGLGRGLEQRLESLIAQPEGQVKV
jgi:hypothetical protein